MKIKLKIFTAISLVVTLSYMGYRIITKIEHKKEIEATIKKMPRFIYETLNHESFTNDSLKPNKKTIFFYFNSECDFCNHEANMIKESKDQFKNVQMVFISFEKVEQIKKFAQKHKLNGYDNIIFVSDFKLSFATTFDVKSLPAVLIYNEQNILIQKLKGQTKPTMILKYL